MKFSFDLCTISGLMPRRRNNRNNQTARAEAHTDEVMSLCVYYVRIHDESDKLKLSMKFGDDYSILFDESQRIYHSNSRSPFIYKVELHVRMNKEKVYLACENGWKELGEYRLKMLYPGTIYGQQKLEVGSEGHSLKDYFHAQHCFHFGIRFGSRFQFMLPGRMH